MHVVHLNTSDTSGGAARAAYRLHGGLREAGVDSSMYVLRRGSGDDAVHRFRPPSGLASRLRRHVRRWRIERDFNAYADSRPDGLEPFSDDRTMYGTQVTDQMPDGDLAHLHWIAGFVDLHAFFASGTQPVVWTLHDMNAFTGGCHYDERCGKHEDGCGACPQLGSDQSGDLSADIWSRKKALYDELPPHRLHVVTLCSWMRELVQSSPLLRKFPVTTIPNGIDVGTFSPVDGSGLRSALSIPEEDRVALFVAQNPTNRRKGFAYLADALAGLHDGGAGDVHVISVGGHEPDLPGDVRLHHLGRITNDALLALAYSTADVFVIPSLQDNLPNTVLESMACGTPVVGFDAGGIPDMVRPGETGWLAETGDVASLRQVLQQALSAPQRDLDRLSRRCREVAVREYSLDVQTRRYRELYTRILDGSLAASSALSSHAS